MVVVVVVVLGIVVVAVVCGGVEAVVDSPIVELPLPEIEQKSRQKQMKILLC